MLGGVQDTVTDPFPGRATASLGGITIVTEPFAVTVETLGVIGSILSPVPLAHGDFIRPSPTFKRTALVSGVPGKILGIQGIDVGIGGIISGMAGPTAGIAGMVNGISG